MSNVNNSTPIKYEKINKTKNIKFGRESADYIVTEMKDIDGAGDEKAGQISSEIQTGICEKCLMYLYFIREPVADYQAKRGISKDEKFSFITLGIELVKCILNTLVCMAFLAFSVVAIMDVSFMFTRFLIDKILHIINSNAMTRIVSIFVLLIEIKLIIISCLIFYGLILTPILAFILSMVYNIWNYVK